MQMTTSDILGEVEIVHRQSKCDRAWVARLEQNTNTILTAATAVGKTTSDVTVTTGSDGKKKTRKDARPSDGPKVRAYQMSARDFRGVFRVVIQEIENDDTSKKTLKQRLIFLKASKHGLRSTSCASF